MKSQKKPKDINSPSGSWADNKKKKCFSRDLIGPLEGRFLYRQFFESDFAENLIIDVARVLQSILKFLSLSNVLLERY